MLEVHVCCEGQYSIDHVVPYGPRAVCGCGCSSLRQSWSLADPLWNQGPLINSVFFQWMLDITRTRTYMYSGYGTCMWWIGESSHHRIVRENHRDETCLTAKAINCRILTWPIFGFRYTRFYNPAWTRALFPWHRSKRAPMNQGPLATSAMYSTKQDAIWIRTKYINKLASQVVNTIITLAALTGPERWSI